MPTLLYLRGDPGSGKITVARILSAQLGWPLLWIHDFYRERRSDPAKVDSLMLPALEAMMDGLDLIFVRPSRSLNTVAKAQYLAQKYGYTVKVVCLTADRQTLAHRVEERGDDFRIHSREQLEEYTTERPLEPVDGELVLNTGRPGWNPSPEAVADLCLQFLQVEVVA